MFLRHFIQHPQVGATFQYWYAQRELGMIASSPSQDHVFQVDNFNALEKIKQSLQEKIFSIEGTANCTVTTKAAVITRC